MYLAKESIPLGRVRPEIGTCVRYCPVHISRERGKRWAILYNFCQLSLWSDDNVLHGRPLEFAIKEFRASLTGH